MVWPKQGGFGVVATTTTGPNDASRCVGWALGEFFFIFFMFFLLIYVFRPTSHPFRPSAPVSTPSRPPAMLFDPSRQPRVLDPQPSVRPVTHLFRVSTTHAMRSWPIATCSRPPAMRSTPHPQPPTRHFRPTTNHSRTPHHLFCTLGTCIRVFPGVFFLFSCFSSLHPGDTRTRVSGVSFLSSHPRYMHMHVPSMSWRYKEGEGRWQWWKWAWFISFLLWFYLFF